MIQCTPEEHNMSNIETPQSPVELPLALIKNMIALATSGFGLVVALAWNEVIKQAVDKFISPYFGSNSGLISLLIYAVVMTLLAVIITMQLSIVERKMEMFHQKLLERKNRKSL
jgi:hypothetical protein